MASTLFILASLFSLSQAAIFPTAPIATTSCTGGRPCLITWTNDATAPSAALFGDTEVGLFVGNRFQQTLLQSFGNIDPAQTLTLSPVILANVGPSEAAADTYFIRFTSLAAVDTTGAPLEAFTSKFILTGMTGTFSPAVAAQISGVTSAGVAPTGGLPATVANATSTSTTPSRLNPTTSSGSSASRSSSSSTATPSSGAVSNKAGLVGSFAAFAGVVAYMI